MLYPQLGPVYYEDKHKEILSMMEAFYAEAYTVNASFWTEAYTDTRYECNDQTLWDTIYAAGNIPINRRRQFAFNRIRPIINMISGYQRRNRKSTIVVPVENGDAQTADQLTKILFWIAKQEGILETISDAFRETCVTGMTLLQVSMDYREDPVSGNIKVDKKSYNSFLIDPYFRKADLSDCRNIWVRSYYDKRTCISFFPERAEEILGLYGNETGTAADYKFNFLPETYGYGYKNLLKYDEFYYRTYRKQKMLVDVETGETMEWKSSDDSMLKEFLRREPRVTVIDQEVPTVRVAITIQNKVFYDGPNPTGADTFPFVPILGYYNPQLPDWPWRIQGVVRGLRDGQFLYNRFLINMADICEAQVNSGYIYKENALVNPADVFLSGNGKGIALKEEAQMTDVQKIAPGEASQSMFKLADIFQNEIFKDSGANEELMGAAVDDKAGILSMLRQGAGLTTLQGLYDQLDQSQKLLGKLMLDLIQLNFTPGKVKKILEEQEPTPQFYNKAFGKYGCTVEQGEDSINQRQLEFAQLLHLREVGVPVPNSVLLKAANIQNKKDLIEAVELEQQQQQQIAQAQAQSEMQEQSSRIQLNQARATADQGLGYERISRVKENQALAIERQAAARKDEEVGLLNLVKALKEIESIDIGHVEKLLSLAQMVREPVQELAQQQSPIAQAQQLQQGQPNAQR